MANQNFSSAPLEVEACILTGGQAKRLGGGKEHLRLAGRSLLDRARAAAAEIPCRLIGRDVVPSCGPLGGVITALRTTRARYVLFLACDMPFLTPALTWQLAHFGSVRALFLETDNRVGFPFRLARETLSAAESLRREGHYSLQALARRLRARRLRTARLAQLFNLNTFADLAAARRQSRLVIPHSLATLASRYA